MTTKRSSWLGLILYVIMVFILFYGTAEAQDSFALSSVGNILTLPQGESLLLPVFEPKRVAVTDPTIADVVMVSTEQVLVNAIGVGTTSLQIWEQRGLSSYRVRVVPNPDALISELRQQLKLPGIQIYIINGHVVLDGVVEESEDKIRAMQLASAYGEVIDLLQTAGAPSEWEMAEAIAQTIARPTIEVRVVNGYTVLEGKVTSLEEHERAQALASTFEHPVLNFLEIASQTKSQDTLAREIAEYIDIPTIQVKGIAQDTLLLEGYVLEPADKERALAIAHAWGKPVVDLIEVREVLSDLDRLTAGDCGSADDMAISSRESDLLVTGKDLPERDQASRSLGGNGPMNPGGLPLNEVGIPDAKSDVALLTEEVQREINDPAITLRTIRHALVMEGKVESNWARERAIAIASLYPWQVVDLLQVKDEPIPDLAREREWLATYIQDPSIKVTAIGRTVLLEGTVQSDTERRRAVAVAEALDLEVVDLLAMEVAAGGMEHEIDGSDEARQSALLHQKEIERLRAIVPDLEVALAEDTLHVFELNGFIILEGQVPNAYRKMRAERIAETFQVPLIALIEVSPDERKESKVGASGLVEESSTRSDALPDLGGDGRGAKATSDTGERGLLEDCLQPSAGEDKLANGGDVNATSDLPWEIASAIGLPGVSVKMVRGAAILDGFVSNELEAQGAMAIAGLYADNVINRLQVISPKGDVSPPLAEIVSGILDLPFVRVNQAGDKLVLEGIVEDQSELERAVQIARAFGNEVINFIKIEAPWQVLIKVRVVEASRVDLENVGFSWGSLERGVFIPDALQIGELMIGEPLQRLLPIGAQLEALIDDGKAKLLAAPSLLTLSGREAEFLSGGEIPVVIPKDGELQIHWKTYGVKLKILPVVIDEDSIEVRVEPEVSTLDWPNAIRLESIALPAMKTRRTDTTIRINDGTTFVISGLLDNSEALQIHKLPILGDLPILGRLFRSEQFTAHETELIFFVTPHILKGNEPAHDHELWRDTAPPHAHEVWREPLSDHKMWLSVDDWPQEGAIDHDDRDAKDAIDHDDGPSDDGINHDGGPMGDAASRVDGPMGDATGHDAIDESATIKGGLD